jgi:hypothetical protein
MLLTLVVLTEREATPRVAAGILAIGLLLPLASWAGCVFAWLGVVYLWASRNRQSARALAAGAAAGSGLLLLFLTLARGGQFGSLFQQFLGRSWRMVADDGRAIGSLRAWVARLLEHGNAVVGWPMVVLALVGVAFAARRETRARVAWLAGSGLLLIGVLRQWSFVHDYSTTYLAVPALLGAAPAAGMLLRLPSRVGRLAITLTVAAVLTLHALPQLQALDPPVPSARHEVELGGILQELTAPTDVVAYALHPPSPIFLYYADRDFLVWPNPLLGSGRVRPKAFVQVGGAPPEDPGFLEWLAIYEPAPGVRGVWLRMAP